MCSVSLGHKQENWQESERDQLSKPTLIFMKLNILSYILSYNSDFKNGLKAFFFSTNHNTVIWEIKTIQNNTFQNLLFTNQSQKGKDWAQSV